MEPGPGRRQSGAGLAWLGRDFPNSSLLSPPEGWLLFSNLNIRERKSVESQNLPKVEGTISVNKFTSDSRVK